MGILVHELTDPQVLGPMGPWVTGSTRKVAHGHMGTWAPGSCMGIKAHDYMGTWVHGPMGPYARRFTSQAST